MTGQQIREASLGQEAIDAIRRRVTGLLMALRTLLEKVDSSEGQHNYRSARPFPKLFFGTQ